MAPSTPPRPQTVNLPTTTVTSMPLAPPTKASRVSFALLRRAVVPALIIIAWIGVTESRLVGETFLPTPAGLWSSLRSLAPLLPSAIASSVGITLSGFALGTALGIGMGLGMAYSKLTREFFGGVFDFLRPVPVFALIPLFVLWFGIGRAPEIALIALGTSVIVGVTTLEAIKNVAPVHVKAALTLGADRKAIYRSVIVPSILPHLLGAVRVAAAASWGLDVAAEFIGAQTGLGYLMITRQQYLDTAGIILIVLIYSVLALILDFIVRRCEAPLTRWTEKGARTGVVAAILGNT